MSASTPSSPPFPGSPLYHPRTYGRKDRQYECHTLERIPAAPSRRLIHFKSTHIADETLNVTDI